ncbi:MAG: deoxyribose-phosphate aldolase [Clostridia bacterium]|nr:deoxyribose-phosphate aldolase [Clostridia bacterium]
MDRKEILSMVDHTILKQGTTLDDIKKLIDEGIEYGVASVCIPPCYVKAAAQYADGRIPICTVIGFPNGYSATAAKVCEAIEAIESGAAEIDTVINICMVKNGDYDELLAELKILRKVCHDVTLKVIIETCLLTEEEKIEMCRVVSESGADFIKTSTGFGGGGATLEDVRLMRAHCADHVKIKASGGVRSFEDAEKFIEAGADRLGTSSLVKICAEGK